MANNFEVGRVLVIGSGAATYTIKSVDGDRVVVDFQREGMKQTFPMTKGAINSLVEQGKMHWADDEPKQEAPKAKAKAEAKAEPKSEPIEDEVEEENAEEVIDEEPVPVRPKVKLRVVTGRIVKDKVREQPVEDEDEGETVEEEPIEDEPKAKPKPKATKRTAKGKYTFATYTTKRGKEAGKIVGLDEDEPAYQRAGEIHASHTWERKDGKRVYVLLFSPRYTDAAREVCNALNEGCDFDDLLDIVETNTEALAAKRAEQKAEYLERKAQREAKKQEAEKAKATAKASKSSATDGEKLYTEAQVKARIRRAFETLAKSLGCKIKDLEPIIKAA